MVAAYNIRIKNLLSVDLFCTTKAGKDSCKLVWRSGHFLGDIEHATRSLSRSNGLIQKKIIIINKKIKVVTESTNSGFNRGIELPEFSNWKLFLDFACPGLLGALVKFEIHGFNLMAKLIKQKVREPQDSSYHRKNEKRKEVLFSI